MSRLPGLGPKSALRIGLTLLQWPEERSRALGDSILTLLDKLCFCEQCAGLAEASPCAICSDPTRDASVLCLVSDWDTVLAMEDSGSYKGLYLVLGGLLSPMENVTPDNLQFSRLADRLAAGEVRELILALGTTMEAENTASYVKNLVESRFKDIKLTRLAQGIPMGADVKFVDKETLRQSLMHRQDL